MKLELSRMDEALKRDFTDAYLRYEIAFAQFTTANSVRADEIEQQAQYREFMDAQQRFLQAANRFAQNLLKQPSPLHDRVLMAEVGPDPKAEPQRSSEPVATLGKAERIPEPLSDAPQDEKLSGGSTRVGWFRFRRSK